MCMYEGHVLQKKGYPSVRILEILEGIIFESVTNRLPYLQLCKTETYLCNIGFSSKFHQKIVSNEKSRPLWPKKIALKFLILLSTFLHAWK